MKYTYILRVVTPAFLRKTKKGSMPQEVGKVWRKAYFKSVQPCLWDAREWLKMSPMPCFS